MNINIKIKAFEPNLVDSTVKKIIEFAKANNIKFSGPIPLPTKKEIFTVLRSVHVNKTSREQFESRTHKRLIILEKVDQKFNESLKRMELPSGVKLDIIVK